MSPCVLRVLGPPRVIWWFGERVRGTGTPYRWVVLIRGEEEKMMRLRRGLQDCPGGTSFLPFLIFVAGTPEIKVRVLEEGVFFRDFLRKGRTQPVANFLDLA